MSETKEKARYMLAFMPNIDDVVPELKNKYFIVEAEHRWDAYQVGTDAGVNVDHYASSHPFDDPDVQDFIKGREEVDIQVAAAIMNINGVHPPNKVSIMATPVDPSELE